MSEPLTLAEVATLLDRNIEQVRVWVVSGRLPARKRADRWFVSTADLRRFQRHEPIRRTWGAEAKQRNAQRWARRRKAK